MLYFLIWLFVHIVVESLPLSSSGHIFLLESLANFSCISFNGACINLNLLSDLLHGVSAIVVALFFRKSWLNMVHHWWQNWHSAVPLIIFVVISDLLTSFLFVLFKLTGKQFFPVTIGFFITAIALLIVSFFTQTSQKKSLNPVITIKNAFILGLVQGCCLLPGISRLGLTYVVGRALGMTHEQSFEISFLIQWPLIAAASACAGAYMIYDGSITYLLHPALLLATLIFAGCAFYVLVGTNYIMRTGKTWIFSVYLMILLVTLLWTGY